MASAPCASAGEIDELHGYSERRRRNMKYESRRISTNSAKDEFLRRTFLPWAGERIALPDKFHPDPAFLNRHYNETFLGYFIATIPWRSGRIDIPFRLPAALGTRQVRQHDVRQVRINSKCSSSGTVPASTAHQSDASTEHRYQHSPDTEH